MWETIGNVLTSPNALVVLIFVFLFVVALYIMSKKGIVAVRNQSQFAYLYIMAIEGKLNNSGESNYYLKWILEKCYDKVVDWITYNHISDTSMYIEIKKEEIKNLIYSLQINEEYKTPEFKQRMEGWVEELILNLLKVRKEYSK